MSQFFLMIPLFYLVKEKSEYFKASIFIEDIENISKTNNKINNNKTIVKNTNINVNWCVLTILVMKLHSASVILIGCYISGASVINSLIRSIPEMVLKE